MRCRIFWNEMMGTKDHGLWTKNYGPHNWFPNARKTIDLKEWVTKGVALEDLGISQFNGRVVCTKGREKNRGTLLLYISQRYHFLFKDSFLQSDKSKTHSERGGPVGWPADPVHNWQTIAAWIFFPSTHSQMRGRQMRYFENVLQ